MVKANKLPCVEILTEYFTYCEVTGKVYLKKGTSQRTKAGDLAGYKRQDGYLAVCFKSQRILLHRLAYKIKTGKEPPINLHHINHDRSDNRWENLSASNPVHNASTRVTSLGYIKKRKKYVAYNTHKGDRRELKYCNCPTAARVAYLKEKVRLGFDVKEMFLQPHLKE